jgi:hypothetical protein
VKVLLKFCDPEEEEEEIARSLYFAAFKGHDKVVALLLNKGANTEFKGRRGTPLQVAAFGAPSSTLDP